MTHAVELSGNAPQMLATALNMAGASITPDHMAKAAEILRNAGTNISIRKNGERERDPAFAAHLPNLADLAAGFSYSAQGSPGHETCCAGRPRGLYQGERPAASIPFVHGIAVARNGRTQISAPLLSATSTGRRAVISWEETRDGTWAMALNTGLSPDRQITTAAAAIINELAYQAGVPQFAAAVTPGARTEDGRIPAPVPECMPDGYWEQAAGPDAARLEARAVQADIAARRPKIALTWGASVGAAFAGPLKLRQSGIWELTGEPRKGKTTTLMLAASAWGHPGLPPDGMLISWDQTAKGTGRHLGELGIFPAFMDETGTADFGPDEWAKLTYSLSLGASRKTAKTRGSMGTNQTPGWQGFLFTTGNGTITEGATAGKFAGVAARVVTISGEFTAGPEECSELDDAVLADYGHVGPAVIGALAVDQFGAMYAEAREALEAPAGGIAGTLAGKVALAVAGARAIDVVLGTGTAIGDAAHAGAIEYLTTLAAPESDRERILRRIAEAMSAERADWADAPGYARWGEVGDRQSRKLSGVYDETWLYVYPSAWAEIVKETGVGASARLALADMHARAELHVPPSRRKRGEWKAPAPTWAGSVEVYKIARAAINDAAPLDGGDEVTPIGAGDGDTAPNLTSGNGGDEVTPIGGGDGHAAPSLTSGNGGTPIGGHGGVSPSLTSSDGGNGGESAKLTDTPIAAPLDGGDGGTPIGGHGGTPPSLTSDDGGNGGDGGQTAPATGKTTTPDGWPADSIGATVNPHAAPASMPAKAPAVPIAAAAVSPAGTPAAPVDSALERHRAAWLSATWKRSDNASHFKAAGQQDALRQIITLLDENPDIADKNAIRDLANRMRVLRMLEGSGKDWGGPFAPTLNKKTARLKPWGKTGVPPCVELARVIEGWAFERPGFSGPVTVFDRNGAWVAATATADVAHGPLERTGERDSASPLLPGYYQVAVYPWTEEGMPAPLGNAEPGTSIWVPAPIAGLLRELAREDRWPDDSAADSWTGQPVRLLAWGRLIREFRRYALETYGYGSGSYQAAKESFSTALAMLNGTIGEDSTRPVRTWDKCKAERIDWRHQIQTHSAATMWRTMDRARKVAGDDPALTPVGMRDKDELIIPTAAAGIVVTRPWAAGGKVPAVRVDNTGVTLGTFKVKTREDR
jgi:hypothetical protein